MVPRILATNPKYGMATAPLREQSCAPHAGLAVRAARRQANKESESKTKRGHEVAKTKCKQNADMTLGASLKNMITEHKINKK